MAQTAAASRKTVVATDRALFHPEVLSLHDAGHRIVIAGDDPIRMALAGVALPMAERIWTNMNMSSQIQTLSAYAARIGGCDILFHAARKNAGAEDTSCSAETLTAIRLLLAFLPGMRPRANARIVAANLPGKTKTSLECFIAQTSLICRDMPDIELIDHPASGHSGPARTFAKAFTLMDPQRTVH